MCQNEQILCAIWCGVFLCKPTQCAKHVQMHLFLLLFLFTLHPNRVWSLLAQALTGPKCKKCKCSANNISAKPLTLTSPKIVCFLETRPCGGPLYVIAYTRRDCVEEGSSLNKGGPCDCPVSQSRPQTWPQHKVHTPAHCCAN